MTSNTKQEQQGLMLISALINFTDWMASEKHPLVAGLSDMDRAMLVKDFFACHAEGESYFMQAEQIAKILGGPFK